MTVCLTDCNDTFLVWLRYAACCPDNKRLTSPAVSLFFFLSILWREKGILMKRFTSSKILNDITHDLESNTMVHAMAKTSCWMLLFSWLNHFMSIHGIRPRNGTVMCQLNSHSICHSPVLRVHVFLTSHSEGLKPKQGCKVLLSMLATSGLVVKFYPQCWLLKVM